MIELFYINKETALKVGATHEGWLYGVPVWFVGAPYGNELTAAPKVPLLQAWLSFCDVLVEMLTYVMPSDMAIEIPVIVKGPIE